jgi:hypothetical protein
MVAGMSPAHLKIEREMTKLEFWNITESAQGDPDRLAEILAALSVEEIVQWDRHLLDLLYEAAGHLATDDPGDREDDFLAWLVSQGRVVFEAALEDPENLLGHLDLEDCQCEALHYAPALAYEMKTGLDDYEEVFGGLAERE